MSNQLGRSRRIALVAVLALVFQTLLAAYAVGAGASAAPVDAYGNQICATGADYGEHGGHDTGHGKLPSCCTLGCPMVSGTLGPASTLVGLHLPTPDAGLDDRRSAPSAISFDPADHPGRPRAPPTTA